MSRYCYKKLGIYNSKRIYYFTLTLVLMCCVCNNKFSNIDIKTYTNTNTYWESTNYSKNRQYGTVRSQFVNNNGLSFLFIRNKYFHNRNFENSIRY